MLGLDSNSIQLLKAMNGSTVRKGLSSIGWMAFPILKWPVLACKCPWLSSILVGGLMNPVHTSL